MSKSGHLRLGDVRAALRLVGECRDLGYDPALWLRHAFEGLCGLVGARVVMGGEVNWARPDGPITPIYAVLVGIPPTVEEALVALAAAGERGPAYGRAVDAVREFEAGMSEHRIKRLVGSGFSDAAAQHISDLHAKSTGNAM